MTTVPAGRPDRVQLPRTGGGTAGPAGWLMRRGRYSVSRLELMTGSLLVLVGAEVIGLSLAWLLTGGKKRKLVRNMICACDPGGSGGCASSAGTTRGSPQAPGASSGGSSSAKLSGRAG